MEFARHPITRQYISAARCRAEFGATAKPARCPVCAQPLLIRANISDGHSFAHYPNAGCPTTARASAPYIGLTPQIPDVDAERTIKRSFRQTWCHHYAQMCRMVPFLSIKEFLNLLDLATQKRTWAYSRLQLGDVPYVLALQCDFPPWTGRQQTISDGWKPMRKFWFRFWLETIDAEVNGLWLPGRTTNLVRTTYAPPRNRRAAPPSLDAIIGEPKDIAVEDTFLALPAPSIPEFVVKVVEDWFNRHPTFLVPA